MLGLASTSNEKDVLSSTVPPLSDHFHIECFGVMTMDYLAVVDGFPKPNTKNRTRSINIQGGGNAANVAHVMYHLLGDGYFLCGSHCEISLISKIGSDYVGDSIIGEFDSLPESSNVSVSLKKIVRGNQVQTAFSYIIVSPSDNSDAKERTILHTPLSEELSFDEMNWIVDSVVNPVDILFLDGRHAAAALRYSSHMSNSLKNIVMECERMRYGSDLHSFLQVMRCAHAITMSEEFSTDYVNYRSENDLTISKWVKNHKQQGACDKFLAVHLLLRELTSNGANIPNFATITLGSKGSLCFLKTEDQSLNKINNLHEIDLYSTTPQILNDLPKTEVKLFEIDDHITGSTICYRVIYSQSFVDESKSIEDTTGAGDTFNAGLLIGLSYFMNSKKVIGWKELEHTLRFANIAAFYTCTGVGARSTLITKEQAQKFWQSLE